MKIAYLGLGSMGAPQARLLARAGHDVTVYDPYPAARAAFAGIAKIANSGEDAARDADAACVCVRDDQQVEEAVLGAQGLAAGLGKGSLLLIHSTIRIQTVQHLQEKLASRGITVLDAAVTRTRKSSDEPFVLTMLGGEPAEVERAKEVVQAFSTEVLHAGPTGAGMALKIANNMVTYIQYLAGVQAQTLATHFGVSSQQLLGVMKANGNLTPIMEALLNLRATTVPGANPERDAHCASQAGNGEKDLMLAMDGYAAAGLDVGMIAKAYDLLRPAMMGV